MQRFVTLSTFLFVTWALSSALVAQKSFTVGDLDKLMKKDGPAQMALVKALSTGNQAVARTQLATLKTGITQAQEFWIEYKREDAIQFGKAVVAKIDELDKIISAPELDSDKALAATRELAATCNSCHKVYRATDDNGQFTLKPGSIPGL
jgi:cytochrome c556